MRRECIGGTLGRGNSKAALEGSRSNLEQLDLGGREICAPNIAKLLVPGRDPGGLIITTLLGIAGAFVAKYVGIALGFYQETDSAGFVASVFGAIIILVIHHPVRRRPAPRA